MSRPLDAAVSGAWIDDPVRSAHQDYVAVLIAAAGLRPGPTTDHSDALLREARSSVESLLRRVTAGLPRIDRLTDVYNAVSVMHAIPIGGEDLSGYQGPARLVVATGDEAFDTVADGQPTMHTAAVGEIVWRDDVGVTCRRWNWRQCVRTRLTDVTTEALFIVDGLGPDAGARARAAADDLVRQLAVDSPDASCASRALVG